MGDKETVLYSWQHRSHTVNLEGSIINAARGSDSDPGPKQCKAAEV